VVPNATYSPLPARIFSFVDISINSRFLESLKNCGCEPFGVALSTLYRLIRIEEAQAWKEKDLKKANV
jgi:hypothetical protein